MKSDVRVTARGRPGLALVMESDTDLRATICGALLLEGHEVQSAGSCAAVLALRREGGRVPDGFLLALGAGDLDPDWEALRLALDDEVHSASAVIVLLTIRNGLIFPARARVVQKPFEMDRLLAMVASDMASAVVRRERPR